MSVNKYNSTTGTLTTLASGDRTWVGTEAAYQAAKTAGTLPNNCLIVITDDETAMDTVPTEGSPVAVTSDGIYNALNWKLLIDLVRGSSSTFTEVNIPEGIKELYIEFYEIDTVSSREIIWDGKLFNRVNIPASGYNIIQFMAPQLSGSTYVNQRQGNVSINHPDHLNKYYFWLDASGTYNIKVFWR